MDTLPYIIADSYRKDAVVSDHVVLSFQNVSKKFCRSLKRSLYYGVQDLFQEIFFLDSKRGELRRQEFWALNNISFNLKKGESIGIVGHNGAGKTTSLKLINGLIKPNTGVIKVEGRVGALIALGAGFNPILTGRENIRVSSAMLGYSKEEIVRKEQEIIDFSEISEFIDSPVQTYSSGMMARLGFAVAIHTEPDILLVDEVLAVGDLNFVIKCFRKIFEYQRNGGAMLLVSHNIYNIRANCSRALWIEKGEMKMFGPVAEVCDAYEEYVANESASSITGQFFKEKGIEIQNLSYPEKFQSGEDLEISFTLKTDVLVEYPILSVAIFTLTGVNIVSTTDKMNCFEVGEHNLKLVFPELPVAIGTYSINLVLANHVINNQLYASTNQNRLNVIGEVGLFGNSGIIHSTSSWTVIK